MRTRGILPLAGALTVTTLVGTIGAQAVALREEPSARPPALAATYHLTLTSDWPGDGDPEGCGNGGQEVVEGTLTRRGPDRYEGTFRRRTILRFCGSHGTSEAECTMTLQGADPSLRRVRWSPTIRARAAARCGSSGAQRRGIRRQPKAPAPPAS